MPFSDPIFDNKLKDVIKNSDDFNFLDIGCGAGKFGYFLRSLKFANENLIGVEVDRSYIKKYSLKKLYTKIFNEDIISFINKRPDFSTDFVFIGDCIEHLKKSDGIDLIHYLLYRSKIIVMIYPDRYVQYSWEGHASEAHRSAWFKDDFKNFDHEFINEGSMNFIIIKGYLFKDNLIH